MRPSFEIKYLELSWYDKEIGIFRAETTIYPKLKDIRKGVLAIRFLEPNNSKPYIKLPNNEICYLASIIDPDTHITWWIFKDEWDSINKQWTSIAPNIVGSISFVLQNQHCELVINGSDFTLEQLEKYLSTFKNDLWELILDDDSIIQVEAKEKKAIAIDEAVLDAISNLVFHTIKVLENPKVELREIQELKPRRTIKPVNRTFMEIATKSNQRLLTSRSNKPSYNVAENSYILFILERCYRIIKQIVLLAENKSNRFQNMIEKFQLQHDNFVDYVQVNRDLFISDLKKLKERKYIDCWRDELNNELVKNHISFSSSYNDQELYLMLEGYTSSLSEPKKKDGFFVLEWNGTKWVKPDDKSGILKLSRGLYSNLLKILKRGMILRFIGNFNKLPKLNSVLFNFDSIESIELWDYPEKIKKAEENFIKEKNKGIILKQNNWRRALSQQEKEEQEREKLSLRNRIQFYTENQKSCDYVFEKIKPKFLILKELIRKLKDLKVKPSSHFPNSMTFVQNPHYQSIHNSYKKLLENTSLQDENILLSLEELDKMGIVNMPLLYERWSLLQIILVLTKVFRFIPKSGSKYQLINAIRNNYKDIEIYLSNEQTKRYIILSYEKMLENGKRPDFTLDLTWFTQKTNEERSKRFILDAKFYDKSTFHKAGGMLAKIDELYTVKNYSEDEKNPVFLIHPCKSLIEQPATSQSWGNYSFLGETDILNDEVFYSHNKGAIYLNPIDNALYNDELQRLLGLFLQYKLEDEDARLENTDQTLAVPICIRCGSSHFQTKPKYGDRTSRSVWLQCLECEQWQVFNHCSTCVHRLIKNGVYWTYHSARALEPFNIKCPHCGEWGGW